MSTIICGFSGIGKSTAEQKNRRILDFESSGYSNIFENGLRVRRNEDFPKNYIDKLEELINVDEADYYLLSCHEEVRNELKARNIDYLIVLPTIEQRNEYLKRWLRRGSSVGFIKSMNERWEYMIKSCKEDEAPKIYLSDGEYISNLICV